MTEIIHCKTCVYYRGDLKCAAFPEGIPDAILLEGNDHSEPLESQENNVTYEKLKE